MSTRARWLFGLADLLTAVIVGIGVFVGLPARYAPVDVSAAVVVALMGAAGVMLLLRARLAERVARVASAVALGAGAVLIAASAWSASYLWGIYAPVGRGGAIILLLVAALALPYLIVLPAAQLVWTMPSASTEKQKKPSEVA
jgi:hypothetical protein